MKNRSELRDIIIKVLYQVYILENTNVKYDVNTLIKEQLEIENDFVKSSIDGVLKNQEKISKLANLYLKDWTIDRLSKVDKAILSLGIYELMYTDTPAVVCINETIELAKKYSDLNVVKMINAAMDAIYHNEDLNGKEYSSEQFAEKLDKITLNNSSITFVIGGSLGLSTEIIHNSNELICFSKMTFPHQLIRVFLLEQIFRAFKINNNETYHR